MNELIEYIKLHIISLEQDLEKLDTYDQEEDSIDWHYVVGQIHATKHLLSVADDILVKTKEQ